MGTESQNNSYYNGSSPGHCSTAIYSSYLQYHNNQPPPQEPTEPNHRVADHGLRGISSSEASASGRSNSYNNNNNWTPVSSSSSSDNSSPSSSSGNYFPELSRNQSNTNYYLQNFCAMGQPKGNWDFMNSAQKQIAYNNFEYNVHNGLANDIGAPNGSSSTSISSSSSSSTSSSQGNSFIGHHAEKRTAQNGGSDQVAYHPFQQQQSHLHTQSHYANTLHYRHQQMLQLAAGKSGNSKDICGEDKHKEDGDPWNEAQAAFLGPNLWDKTLPYDADLKVHQYVDLDEFLSENNIPVDVNNLGNGTGMGHRSSESISHTNGLLGLPTKREKRSPSPSDCVSPDTMNPPSPAESTFSFTSSGREFDPRSRAISDEDMKPQPMIKKSRKQFVPEELKDDKYWARRRKNNIAAKRSRDARRQKENQIALRARFLEKENMGLQQEVDQLRQENLELRARLSKFQDV